MKRNIIIALALTLFLSCFPVCRHVHTEECGENGENCTHICHEIELFGREWPDQ